MSKLQKSENLFINKLHLGFLEIKNENISPLDAKLWNGRQIVQMKLSKNSNIYIFLLIS